MWGEEKTGIDGWMGDELHFEGFWIFFPPLLYSLIGSSETSSF